MTRPVARLVRRVVIAPLTVVLGVALLAVMPVLLLLAAVLAPVLPGGRRTLRLLTMGGLYLAAEVLLLVVLFGWWFATGLGRRARTPYWEGVHYDLVQHTFWMLFRAARWVLRFEILTDGPDPDAHPGRPIVVACRHAGPGDSFTLVHALMHSYLREPRVVLKDTLAWDPAIGVLLDRLPARFISPGGGAHLGEEIRGLADGLDDNDALVIFPEGGNFSAERRRRGIERLRRLGLEAMARRAEGMTSVLAPRPGGLFAALDGAPDADVVMVAHTGLDHLVTTGDLWRALPVEKRVVMRWWDVAREDIPTGEDARVEWLFDWWERIDAWVAANAPASVSGNADAGRPG